MELVPRLFIVQDVNGYYRELGVSPDATRLEIRHAYQRLKGWLSPRLTYIVTQLLDREIRDRYDRAPIGALFLDDYVKSFIEARIKRKVDDLRRRGLMSDRQYEEYRDEVEKERLSFDNNPSQREGIVTDTPERWAWSYYLWRSNCDDTERLRKWQELLISALGERKEHHQLAIGFVGDMESAFEVRMVGYRRVVFLNDREQPNELLAELASSRVIASF